MKNILVKIRHFMTNMVCGLIYNRATRKRVRAALNSPIVELIGFIKKDCGIKHPKFKIITGFRGRNLLIKVNDKYIYKYPTQKCNFAPNIETRERDITHELAKFSPVFIPVPTLLNFQDKILRRYDVVHGLSLRQLIDMGNKYSQHKTHLAYQVANFLDAIAQCDPAAIRHYKDNPKDRPGFMYGWHHCDLLDNFMIDEKTFNVTSFIDWEEVGFGDFSTMLRDKNPILDDFMRTVGEEYKKIYTQRTNK